MLYFLQRQTGPQFGFFKVEMLNSLLIFVKRYCIYYYFVFGLLSVRCFQLLDQGTLMSHHGHDFDRKTRRLVVKIATAADILPESVFIQSGIGLLEREPYSGGGFSDIFRASYGGEKMALKRLRVYRNNHDRARINRVGVRRIAWGAQYSPYLCFRNSVARR